MKATVSAEWSYRGLPAVVLDNGLIRIVVLPTLGGKVWDLHDLRTGRQFLWHHPRIGAAPVSFGSTFDDVFHGGWDELFPNDLPETLAGEPYPDHGEVWALPWSWAIIDDGDEIGVDLSVRTPISACTLTKSLRIKDGEASLHIRQRLSNDSSRDLPFMWKQHLAVAVEGDARIDLPATSVYVEDFGAQRGPLTGTTYTWPHAVDASGESHDMRRTLPQSSGVAEFQYATELSDGWCAITHADGTGIALAFDREVFSSCWTFASYGGWRDLQVAILEPCTGYPVSVSDGVSAGTQRILPAGAVIETDLTAVVYSGLASVTSVSIDGGIAGEAR
jgi:hypothetical protein